MKHGRVGQAWMWCALAACLASGGAGAQAEISKIIRYQGQALDANGVPLEGPYTLTFRLYDAETAGTKTWEETQPNTAISAGQFSVLLGQVTPFTTDWSAPAWLSLQVGADAELSPRQRITAVPLALRAQTAEQLAGGGSASVRVYHTTNISIANATSTPLAFNTERWDTANLHSTTTNTGRLTASTAGRYAIFGNVLFMWPGSGGGHRELWIRVNGATLIARINEPVITSPASDVMMSISTCYDLAANDYVEFLVYHTAGTAVTIEAKPSYSPEFGMVKLQ